MPERVYPSGIEGSQARNKSPYNQRRKKIRPEQQRPKLEDKQRRPFPRRANRKPSPRPRPRLSTVCPALALSGLPLPRRLRFAPPLAGAPPASVPLSPSLSRPVGSFLRRSPPSAGRVFPRSAGRVFSALGGVGLPSFSRGRGRGLGFRACVRCRACCAFRGASVPLDTIRNNSNIFDG